MEVDALSRIRWCHDDAIIVKTILARDLNADTMIPLQNVNIQCHNINWVKHSKVSNEEWVQQQSADKDIGPVIELVRWNNI